MACCGNDRCGFCHVGRVLLPHGIAALEDFNCCGAARKEESVDRSHSCSFPRIDGKFYPMFLAFQDALSLTFELTSYKQQEHLCRSQETIVGHVVVAIALPE